MFSTRIPEGANRYSIPLMPSARVLANIGDFLCAEATNKRRVVVVANGATALTHVSEHVQRTVVALKVIHVAKRPPVIPTSPKWYNQEADVLFTTYIESAAGVDLGAYDTVLFLGLPHESSELIQAGGRIARIHRPDDLSFKKWVIGWDGSFGKEARLAGVAWAQHHLNQYFDENRVSVVDLNSEPSYVAPSGDQLRQHS